MRLTLSPTIDAEADQKLGPECCHPTVSIDFPFDGMTIREMWRNVLVPALLAWGYDRDTIATIEQLSR